MVSLGQNKMAGQLTSKWKSGNIATQIFRMNKSRSKKRGKREKSKVKKNKLPSRQRSAGINTKGIYPKFAITSGKTKEKRTNKSRKSARL